MNIASRILRQIARKSPIKIHSRLFKRGPGRPPNSGLGYYRPVKLTRPDHNLLAAWAKEKGISSRAMAHLVIEGFMLCKEDDHHTVIKKLTIERALLCDELEKYINHYGKLTSKEVPQPKPSEKIKPQS